jgi:hypothetical protein
MFKLETKFCPEDKKNLKKIWKNYLGKLSLIFQISFLFKLNADHLALSYFMKKKYFYFNKVEEIVEKFINLLKTRKEFRTKKSL